MSTKQRPMETRQANPEKEIVVIQRAKLNAILKLTGMVSQAIPSAGAFFLFIGAWDFKDDRLDGAASAIVLACGLIGCICWMIADNVLSNK